MRYIYGEKQVDCDKGSTGEHLQLYLESFVLISEASINLEILMNIVQAMGGPKQSRHTL